jgi:hypothetical protein
VKKVESFIEEKENRGLSVTMLLLASGWLTLYFFMKLLSGWNLGIVPDSAAITLYAQ